MQRRWICSRCGLDNSPTSKTCAKCETSRSAPFTKEVPLQQAPSTSTAEGTSDALLRSIAENVDSIRKAVQFFVVLTVISLLVAMCSALTNLA